MALEDKLKELMTDSVTVASVTSTDAYAKHSWGTGTSLANCRVESGSWKVLSVDGQEVVTSGRVFIPNGPMLTPEHKLTFTDGTSARIVAIERHTDERGSHHLVVYYGKGKM